MLNRSISALVNSTKSLNFSSRKFHFLVTIKDFPNALEKRLSVRPAHLQRAITAYDNGTVVIGGALMSDHEQSGKGRATAAQKEEEAYMLGSAFVLNMPTKEACLDFIKDDPYIQGDVWDLRTVSIHPMHLAKH